MPTELLVQPQPASPRHNVEPPEGVPFGNNAGGPKEITMHAASTTTPREETPPAAGTAAADSAIHSMDASSGESPVTPSGMVGVETSAKLSRDHHHMLKNGTTTPTANPASPASTAESSSSSSLASTSVSASASSSNNNNNKQGNTKTMSETSRPYAVRNSNSNHSNDGSVHVASAPVPVPMPPHVILSHDLFPIVLERAATRINQSAPSSRRQSAHLSSSASSVRSVKWSSDIPPAGTPLVRQNSWSAADMHKSKQQQQQHRQSKSAVEGALSKEAPDTYHDRPSPSSSSAGVNKRSSGSMPASAAASASPTASPIRGILMAAANGIGSRRPSLATVNSQQSRPNSPRPSFSQNRPQSIYALPHVSDDAQARFLKVADGLTFRYHPNQPLGGPGHFGRVYLGVNIDDPSDLVAIKFPHMTEEEHLKAMRRAGLFGHRKGHEARALRRMGMLRGEVPLGDGRNALVMDYVAGLEPQELVDQGLITSEARLRKLASKTRHAVTRAIHRRGIAHSDVHAGNIRYRVEPKIPWWQRYLCFCPRLPGPLARFAGPTHTYAASTISGASDGDGLMGFGFPITPATTQDGNGNGSSLRLGMFPTRNSVRSLFGGRRSSTGRGLGFADVPAGTMEPGDVHAQSSPMPSKLSYTFTPQFIDFGMARFLSELSQSEAAHAVESDRQRAYDAIWTQRHRLPRDRRSSVGTPSATTTSRTGNNGAQTVSGRPLNNGTTASLQNRRTAAGGSSSKQTARAAATTTTITRVGAARKLD
ncbi:hypothetical protein SYNPS1DRAFT_30136 [Syncephalis pseudoplumigaleata]|uniref:ABC1 atypical kinase-like domain-containing protein n=1 Tax=Syncephalis pseudoplumigaleata TaxID=1712513 RepID=A0A4P9YW75_9FUNG|nr:hypothetical protein SYNPS1DRAFT_30136 [Syncephalis pseudoplumigaleata]|eukprot:RKP24098.1 hypothetical protein SYNPS1DRAFT_30136 [Syncephalis pseudoplumigaleata]